MSGAPLDPATRLAQALGRVSEPYGEITPPVHLSSTYERAADGSYPGGRIYARDATPAYDAVEALLAGLEGGAEAKLFPSGMAAAGALLATLRPGERLLAPIRMYWSLRSWLLRQSEFAGFAVDFYDNTDLAELGTRLAAAPTRWVWVETPANPTWEVTDIAAVVALAHAAGAKVAVDSTVATPLLTRPLELGADLVMHSATKYLNGHSDVVAGVLVTRATDDDWTRIAAWRSQGGGILGPFEAWLLQRGLRTLHLRVAAASRSALELATWLETQPQVRAVLYPGLPSHPQHAIAARQMQGGFGGMLSVQIQGGEAAAKAVTGALQVFKRATSLGGVESLAEHRASVEGPGTQCPDDLIRLSVGIEAVADLRADLAQALATLG